MHLKDWMNFERRPGMWSYRACVLYLAEYLVVNPATIYGIANGAFMPSLKNAIKLQEATGGRVTPEDLYDFWVSKQSDDREVSACG